MSSVRISTNALDITQSSSGDPGAEAEQWLFSDTPSSFREHIESHVEGRTFEGATIREVVPFTMSDAKKHFLAMTEDAAEETVFVSFKEGTINLTSRETSFSLAKVMEPPRGSKYVMLSAIMLKYRPLVSTFAMASSAFVRLNDKGIIGSETSPTVSFSKTLGANILMGLSYPVPLKNIKDLVLTIGVGATGVAKGRAWAAVELAVGLRFSAKPLTSGMTRSVVQYELPSDIFTVESTDPRVFHADLAQQDLDALRDIKNDIPGARTVRMEATGSLARKVSEVRQVVEATQTTDENYLQVDPFSLQSTSGGPSSPRPKEAPSAAAIDAAAERMRSLGFSVERAESAGHAAQRQIGVAPSDTQLAVRTGLIGVIGQFSPTMPISGPSAARELPDGAMQLANAHLKHVVHVRIDDAHPENTIVRALPFDGSVAMSLEVLMKFMEDIVFN